ncbi:MAG: hypothetical protein A4S09_07190 [Proteobacteria bacterium SG_bin7]|nr:MAG: hypothetical protein A4S09_07190 [Proteobacteria bacterium SG_bin7]
MNLSFAKFVAFLFPTLFLVSAIAAKPYWNEDLPAVKKVPGLDADQMDQLFTNLAEVTSPTVVNIFSTSKVQSGGRQMRGMDPDDFFNFFFGNPFDMPFGQPIERESKALGSGFVLNSDGYVITNSHVVRPVGRNADDVRIKFIGEKRGEGLAAKIVGVDPSTDVALLKLKSHTGKSLKVASLGNSDDLKVGNWVIAIGNPYGHAHSVTQGIVSALGRNIPEINAEFIQTSASINPGNSGGPLINLKGQVVGINTAIDPRAQGIGFAIPINTAKNVIRQLIEKGEVSRGWLGVAIADLTPDVAKQLQVDAPEGALIQHVEKGQPADKAGIRVYDVVTEVNGKQIASASELITYVSQVPIGQKAKLHIFRDGKPLDIFVTVEQRPADNKIGRRGDDNGDDEQPTRQGPGADLAGKTGMVLVELTDQFRRKGNLPSGTKGVLVQHVLPYSLAYQAQIRPGDVISEINRKAVSSVKMAEKEIDTSLKKEKKLLLRVVRNQESRIVLLDLSER